MADIDIAMPCFNCAPWLDTFLKSLLSQEVTNWRLVARDDGSTDGTASLLDVWKGRLGERMKLVQGSAGKNLGVVGNYNLVLADTSARWVMTADPDDVWLPGRLQRTLAALKEAEDRLGEEMPLAVCTDAEVIDDSDKVVAPSYWRWARNDPSRVKRIDQVAMESPALGSTMAVNRALLDVALPIDAAAPYQDWWLAMAAAAFGRIITLPDRTILYRRHGGNSTAIPMSSSLGGAIRRVLRSPDAPRQRLKRVLFGQAVPQAAAFLIRYRDRLPSADSDTLEALARLPSRGPIRRRLDLVRHHLWFASTFKNIGMIVLC
jgi:glycosyltransferase involved in cell wall biosynthesis